LPQASAPPLGPQSTPIRILNNEDMEAPALNEQGNMYYGQPGQYGMPSPYGAVDYDAGIPAGEKLPVPSMFGSKAALARGKRRRMNIRPLFMCILVPWGLFSVVYAALSFSIHFNQPTLCSAIILGALVAVLVAAAFALTASGRWFANAEREPNWLVFLFASMLLALIGAYVLGSENYAQNMQKYYNIMNLNNYTDVSPASVHGEQVMDAGLIEFSEGSHLDLSKSMGFKNDKIYCVAPVTIGDAKLGTYDFWVVGQDCCSSNQADYRCKNYNNVHANGGLRLMSESDRAYYRLAVQQAEATYAIQAEHPLFFSWTVGPSDVVEAWKQTGRSEFLVWMLSYAVFQTFLVAVAALAFAKMGL